MHRNNHAKWHVNITVLNIFIRVTVGISFGVRTPVRTLSYIYTITISLRIFRRITVHCLKSYTQK